jgi:hypothetical protein
VRPGVDIAALEAQVRHVTLPFLEWPAAPFSFTTDEVFSTPGGEVKKLSVCAILNGCSSEGADVRLVEEVLLHLQVGNRSAVSSVSFQAFTKA